MKKITLLASIAMLMSHYASADHEQGFFAGAAISYISSDSIIDPTIADDDEIDLPAIEINVGYKYNTFLGLDLRYGAGLSDRDVDLLGSTDQQQYSIDNYQSIYYRPELINDAAKIYALIGYTQLDATIETVNDEGVVQSETEFSESGSSFGLGVGWFIDDDFNINVEWRMLLDRDEEEFSIVTVGIDYRI